VPAPRVALAWDEPASVASAGAWRYLLERKLGYPLAPVRVRDLGSPWLDQFNVLILPHAEDYRQAMGEGATRNLRRWVSRGGTLVGIGGALEYLAAADLLAIRPELRAVREDSEHDVSEREALKGKSGTPDDGGPESEKDDESGPVPGSIISGDEEYRAAIRPEEERPEAIPGVLVKASVDADHWLSAGLPAQLPFMVAGHHMFTPLRLDKGINVLSFLAADELVAGGHLWQEARMQLARKPAVVVQTHERGQVIGFVADPAFRGIMDGLDVLVANALFFGPAMAGPVPAPPVQGR
jgi:hypothetical protein